MLPRLTAKCRQSLGSASLHGLVWSDTVNVSITHTQAYTYTHIYADTQTRASARTHTHTHTHTRDTLAQTHTHAHAYTHARAPERERERGGGENEQANFFINEGNGISTIRFFTSNPLAKRERERKTCFTVLHVK